MSTIGLVLPDVSPCKSLQCNGVGHAMSDNCIVVICKESSGHINRGILCLGKEMVERELRDRPRVERGGREKERGTKENI